MSKYVYIVLGVLVIAMGGYFWKTSAGNKTQAPMAANNSKTAPAAQTAPVETNKIVYTDTGYSPQFIAVKVGDTVTFTNNSSSGMWVASAPHPTHTDYPEFDAKKAYNPGESYTFTFTKVGVWKFHNHLNPTNFGSVTVK